ncbi:MAG: type III pantothenate kinase [Prevotella sp.]|jgi:type III pantothenate kinase
MEQILVIDIGNSNIVVGVMAESQVLDSRRIATVLGKGEADTLASVETVLLEFQTRYLQFEGGIISSVVPELTPAVREMALQVTGVAMMTMGEDKLNLGMEICVEHPERLGHDRIADAIGAMSQFPCPLVVIDMGTATTVNVVDREGRFVGGMIIPGVQTSFDALCSRASQLSEVPLRVPEHLIGKNTAECMQSGIIYGSAAMIDGLVDRVVAELKSDITIVTTGGLAPLVSPHCRHKVVYDEFLLFKGLYCIYIDNKVVCPESRRACELQLNLSGLENK